MPGRAPKPSALRARTNSESASLVLTGNPDAEVPELPTIRPWQDSTRDFWVTVWTSGMAEMYIAADVPGLLRLALLLDDFLRAESAEERRALSSELRQLEKAYGLNPESRTKLRWLVTEADRAAAAKDDEKPPRPISADRSVLFE